MVCPWALQ